MNPDEDIYNQPTEAFAGANPAAQIPPTQAQHMPNIPPAPAAPASAAPHKRKISRRALIGASLAGVAGASIGGFAVEQMLQRGGLNAIFHLNGSMASTPQIGHLLRRAGFGASPADLSAYSALGFNGAVDRLLNYQQVSEDDTESRLKALNLKFGKALDQQRWWLLRMAWTQRPLLEKMTLFWHGVLVSSYHKVGGGRFYARIMTQNQFLREHAFDTYDNILLGITADPAMLFYLDLTKSTKQAPNENYARELMELFSLGLGHYTQQDVFEGAAALTGWHVKGFTSHYLPGDHNDLTKTYLGQTGNFDYKDVVRILANHPATPWFICRKLFTFFVYENPTPDDLKPLVDTYVQSGHNMGQVMRTLLLSPQFSSAKAYRSRIKSPVEYTVGAYRALNLQGDGNGLPVFPLLMGQTVFDPPNVAGWPGDKVSALWLNSGTWMTRLNYIDVLLARGTFTAREQPSPLDLQGIVNANTIDSPERFVDYFSSFLLDGIVDPERRTQYIDYFSAKDTSRGGAQITLKNGRSYPLNRVRGTLYLIMASPEYQLN
ncbi:MAG TPA: DUF1800 domain-containing protein [Ktedonobacteraceae bacterium]|nr:DUF1800 domain-containing protein [Ktedonobacteraceae bacterium]